MSFVICSKCRQQVDYFDFISGGHSCAVNLPQKELYMKQSGFTLIELSISLIVVSLVVGGVLKGQSMIYNAKVHSTIKTQAETQAAINAFVDRYRALPGDYASGATLGSQNGNGNGRIESINHENTLLWSHLSAAKFVTGSYSYDGSSPPDLSNTPVNSYGTLIDVVYDNNFGNGSVSVRHNIKLGNMIPSNILNEVDRKIDDGNPYGGTLQFSQFSFDGEYPSKTLCVTDGKWNVEGETNCGAAWLM